AEDGIRDRNVTGVQTCALPILEVPAAAMVADKLAKYVDFFSIGTYDLIGYSMAADRGNEKISYLYQPYNPSILRLIKNTIEASRSEERRVGKEIRLRYPTGSRK